MRQAVQNSILVLCSLLVTLLLAEGATRLILAGGSEPLAQADLRLGVIREPGQIGQWAQPGGEVAASFRINVQGWNNSFDYSTQSRRPHRIAIIGDSFVEALQVEPSASFPEQLHRHLADCADVYRFGMGSAPLSQYWAMMRYAVEEYHPDILVVFIFTNDFEQSFPVASQSPYFWRFERSSDGEGFTPVPPEHFTPDWLGRTSALYRMIKGVSPASFTVRPVGSPDPRDVTDFMPWMLGEFRAIAESSGAQLLIMLEGDRAGLYGIKDPYAVYDLPAKRDLVLQSAAAQSIEVLDLDPVYVAAYAQNAQRLEFHKDWHWNEYGHQVVAAALEDWARANVCE